MWKYILAHVALLCNRQEPFMQSWSRSTQRFLAKGNENPFSSLGAVRFKDFPLLVHGAF